MTHLLRATVLLLANALMTSSCLFMKKSPPSESSPQHTAGAPTLTSLPGLWVDVPDSFVRKAMESKNTPLLSDRALAGKRLQFWTDAMDEAMRRKHSELMKSVPKPRVYVEATRSVNASTPGVAVCFAVAVATGDDPSAAPTQVNSIEYSPSRGRTGPIADTARCIPAAEVGISLNDVLARWSERAGTATDICRIEKHANELRISGPCSQMPKGHITANMLQVILSSNVISILGGSITELGEESTASVLAHEMAHFYRAHISRTQNDLGYFYEQQLRANPSTRPEPTRDPELLALGKRLTTIEPLFIDRWAGQKYNTKIFEDLIYSGNGIDEEIRKVCKIGMPSEAPCAHKCKTFVEEVRSREIRRIVEWDTPKTDEQRTRYAKFEDQFTDCASGIALKKGEPTLGTLPWELPLDRQNSLWRTALRERYETENPATLSDAAKVLTLSLDGLEKRQNEDRKAAISKRLGWYTVEQEADDLAAELLAAVHIHPKALHDLFFKLLEKAGSSPTGDFLDSKQCRQAYTDHWKDHEGNISIVPVGHWLNNHHSHCYRIFNSDREIRAHSWDDIIESSKRPIAPDSMSWSEIQAEVEQAIRRLDDRRRQ